MSQDSLIFALSFAVAGMFAGAWSLKVIRRRGAPRWPTAGAQVDASGLRYEGGDPSGAFVASVRYHYLGPGGVHAGVHERNFLTQGRAEKWLAMYATGSVLTVRVNPRQPAASVILENDNPEPRSRAAQTRIGVNP